MSTDQHNLQRLPLKVAAGGESRREVVLAEAVGNNDIFIIRNIPAFVSGLALNDSVEMLDVESGDFRVWDRSGQVTIRLYIEGSLDRPDVKALIKNVVAQGGQYEVGRNSLNENHLSLLLLSLDVKIGFPRIEEIMSPFRGNLFRWEYGNVYDEDGALLDWWKK